MIDPSSHTRYYSDLKLETWFPKGVLDAAMTAFIVSYISYEEQLRDEPFNRFADLRRITGIQMDFMELAEFAAERRQAAAHRPPVKTALLATEAATFGVAKMFAALMEPSPIDVAVFIDIEAAALWLGVPEAVLQPEQ